MNKNRRNKKSSKIRGKNPHIGRKRSQYTNNAGLSVSSLVETEKNENGYTGEIFSSKDYETRYALIAATNQTDFGFNSKKDRTVYVLSGSLFVTTEDSDGNKHYERLLRGGHVNLTKGTKYFFSTTTESAEVLIISGAGYDKAWTKLADGSARPTNIVMKTAVTSEVVTPAPRRSRRNSASVPARRPREVNQERRRRSGDPNAAAVMGTNPMPVMPTEE